MKKQWVRALRDDTRARWASLYATINPEGIIVITRFTHQALKDAEYFTLLYDRQTNTIGISPANQREPHAYPAKSRGKNGGRKIRAFRMLRQFDIEIPKTIRFTRPEIDEDGILNLNLTTARLVRG